MTVDTTSPTTRRALLGAGLGAIVASVATVVGRPAVTHAADGEPVKLGEANSATATTRVTTTDAIALVGESGAGTGISGISDTGAGMTAVSQANIGILAVSESGIAIGGLNGATGLAAVAGHSVGSSTGVAGYSTATLGARGPVARVLRAALRPGASLPAGTSPAPDKTGVYGEASQDRSAVGVQGFSEFGTGVRGRSTSGVALAAQGRVRFSTSGVATLAAGSASTTIAPGVDVTPGSFVLLSPKGNIGTRALWYTTNPGGNSFTIRLSSPAAAKLGVAWLLVG